MIDQHDNQPPATRANPLLFAVLGALVALAASALWFYWPGKQIVNSAANSAMGEPTAGTKATAESPSASAASATSESPENSNQVELSAATIQRGQIETGVVTTQTIHESLEVPGTFAINEDNVVRAGTIVSGRVTKVLAMVGDYVKKGQSLVYIHSHELLDARAAAAQAVVAVNDKEKALAYAKAELARAQRLVEAKALAQRELDRANADVNAASSALEHAKAEKIRAEEFLEHLTVPHDSHDDVVIVAPLSGIVTQRNVSIGTVVSEATDLIAVADLSTIWAIAEVPERQAAAIRLGQTVSLNVPAFAAGRFSGRITHIGTTLNPATRTIPVRCQVANANGKLRPEMSALVTLSAGPTTNALVVPRDAVQEIKGERVIFRELESSKAGSKYEKVTVQTGRLQDQLIEIISGATSGQRVVTKGAFYVKTEFLKAVLADE